MALSLRLLLAATCAVGSCFAVAGTGITQFEVTATDSNQEPPPPPPPVDFLTQMVPLPVFAAQYLEAWSITIDADAMRYGPPSIALYLPDQPPDVVDLVHWEARDGYVPGDGVLVPNPAADPSDFSWRWYGTSGRFTVALTMVNGSLAGRISAPNDVHYDIAPSPSGEILGITNSEYWETEPPPQGGGADGEDSSAESLDSLSPPVSPTGAWDYTCSTSLKPGYHNVDVLMMYTTGILAFYGSVPAVTATGQAALDDANQALRNINITSYRYNLIGVTAVDSAHPYDTETISHALNDLAGITVTGTPPDYCSYPGNSYVHSQRAAHNADIVTLARKDATGEGSCGISRAQHKQTYNDCVREVGPSFSDHFAYMVFDPGCNSDRLNMAHEMGHLLGMEHDPRNVDLTGVIKSCPWSYGHRRSDGTTTGRFNFRTIMAYPFAGTGAGPVCSNSAQCPQIDGYSDPNLEWDGVNNGVNPPPWGINPLGTLAGAHPIGVAAPPPYANAFDTLQRIAPIVEAFYARPDQIFINGFEH